MLLANRYNVIAYVMPVKQPSFLRDPIFRTRNAPEAGRVHPAWVSKNGSVNQQEKAALDSKTSLSDELSD